MYLRFPLLINRPKMNSDTDYVLIYKAEAGLCTATLGRNTGKNKSMGLDPVECSDRDIFHELFHILGFLHEHQRGDRDNYVTINWQNIPINYNSQFVALSKSKTLGMPYDATSITHYTWDQGANPIGASSITSKVVIFHLK